jgi:5-(carboxyamino)imidazole ribonucleotide synthase
VKIGIIGGGQLGRMLALAAHPLGLSPVFYEQTADTCAAAVGPVSTGRFDDHAALAAFAASVDVVTFDWENVPVESIRPLTRFTRVSPPAAALELSQDRLTEKDLFRRLRIPTPGYAAVDRASDLARAIDRFGLPGVLKTRRFGYDGKGQAVLRTPGEARAGFRRLAGQPLIFEQFVPFEREVSLVAVRARSGEIRTYPLAENVHEQGILASSSAPFTDPRLARAASAHVRRLLEEMDYVGVLAVEFFVRAGRLIANEMAPRVHNSGHWTIEGAVTSQFENHVRAIAGLPLGDTAAVGHAVMVNFIGRMPAAARVLAVPGAHLHDYGKSPRPGRKLGHATVVAASTAAQARARRTLLALRRR